MKKIVLIRHGQSQYNLENRFTGWYDCPLSGHGVSEAKKAARLLKENDFLFDEAYTSLLKRAIDTLNIILSELNQEWIPVNKTWRLNEKHYGVLQGLNKKETAEKYGEEQVLLWRRGFAVRPAPLDTNDERSPFKDRRYKNVPSQYLPLTESLKDAIARCLPYWQEEIFPSLKRNNQIIVAAHGNSLRGIVKYLKNISDKDIASFNLPTAVPYVFEFDDNLNYARDYFLGDEREIKKLMQQTASQGGK